MDKIKALEDIAEAAYEILKIVETQGGIPDDNKDRPYRIGGFVLRMLKESLQEAGAPF